MKIATILLWILWSLLFLAWPTDMLVALMRDPVEPSEVDSRFASILGYVGFFSLALTFFFKWLLLRFVISPKRVSCSSPWAIVIFIVGSLTIWGLTKSVETYGLIIFFQSDSISHYLMFWVPSIMIMLVHIPFLLDPRRGNESEVQQG